MKKLKFYLGFSKTQKRIILMLFCFFSLFVVRYFNNLLLYNLKIEAEMYGSVSDERHLSINKGFNFSNSISEQYKTDYISSDEKIIIEHSFDLFYPNKYFILNCSEDNYRFYTPWSLINVKKGITKLFIYNNEKIKVINPDSTIKFIYSDFDNYYINKISDIDMKLFSKNKRISKSIIAKRYYEINEKSKIFSLYFYGIMMLLMILFIEGFKVKLGGIYFAIMSFLFGDIFILGGMLFNINYFVVMSQNIIIKMTMFLIFILFIKILYSEFKNLKKLQVNDIINGLIGHCSKF